MFGVVVGELYLMLKDLDLSFGVNIVRRILIVRS